MISHSPDQIRSVSFLTPLSSFYIAIILNHSLLAQLLIQLQPFFCFCPLHFPQPASLPRHTVSFFSPCCQPLQALFCFYHLFPLRLFSVLFSWMLLQPCTPALLKYSPLPLLPPNFFSPATVYLSHQTPKEGAVRPQRQFLCSQLLCGLGGLQGESNPA